MSPMRWVTLGAAVLAAAVPAASSAPPAPGGEFLVNSYTTGNQGSASVATGCAPQRYCPADALTRDQMAVFIAGGFGLSLYAP